MDERNHGEDDFLRDVPKLVVLPNSVLTTIMEWTVRISNPGQLIKLALACRALHRSTMEAEGLWEQISIRQGWSRPPSRPRPPLTAPDLPSNPTAATPTTATTSITTTTTTSTSTSTFCAQYLDLRWFRYYTGRMTSRRNVRRFMRLYLSFLPRPSSMALMPGAEPAALSSCEQRLGVPLPWEVWELYRFRNGQAAAAFVTFADDMRLLGLHEVTLERHPGLAELRQRLELMGATHSAELPRPVGHLGAVGRFGPTERSAEEEEAKAAMLTAAGSRGASSGAQAAFPGPPPSLHHAGDGKEGGEEGDVEGERVLVVATNPSLSRRLLVALNGQVYLSRGLSISFFASSVAAMVQKLLR